MRGAFLRRNQHLAAARRPPNQQRARRMTTSAAATRPLRVHFIHRGTPQAELLQWGLHVWGAASFTTDWSSPLTPNGSDARSSYWDLLVSSEDSAVVGLLVHKGELKAARAEVALPSSQREVWLVGRETASHVFLLLRSNLSSSPLCYCDHRWGMSSKLFSPSLTNRLYLPEASPSSRLCLSTNGPSHGAFHLVGRGGLIASGCTTAEMPR